MIALVQAVQAVAPEVPAPLPSVHWAHWVADFAGLVIALALAITSIQLLRAHTSWRESVEERMALLLVLTQLTNHHIAGRCLQCSLRLVYEANVKAPPVRKVVESMVEKSPYTLAEVLAHTPCDDEELEVH